MLFATAKFHELVKLPPDIASTSFPTGKAVVVWRTGETFEAKLGHGPIG